MPRREIASGLDDAMLLDAHDPVRKGGTGRDVDWAERTTDRARHEVILAGGLDPENVVTRSRGCALMVSMSRRGSG